MTNGASVLNGAMGMPTKLRSWITPRRQQDDEETEAGASRRNSPGGVYGPSGTEYEQSCYGLARPCDADRRYRQRETSNYCSHGPSFRALLQQQSDVLDESPNAL